MSSARRLTKEFYVNQTQAFYVFSKPNANQELLVLYDL